MKKSAIALSLAVVAMCADGCIPWELLPDGGGGGEPYIFWGTYLGGTDFDDGTDVAVDPSGNIYVAGETDSSGWISGGWDTSSFGGGYLVKLNAAGVPLWSTYLGLGGEEGSRIAVDSSGDVYAVGVTYSPDWVSGGWDTSYNGGNDGSVVKLSATGAHLWSTYLGGTGRDRSYGVAVDSSNDVYVTGYTNSPDWVSGGWDTSYNGEGEGDYNFDSYLVKLSSAGAHLWSTYLGETGNDESYDVAVDQSGNVYVAGAVSPLPTDDCDGCVMKLSPAGVHLWSTCFGGTGSETSFSIAVDSHDNIYVAGVTDSSDWDTSYKGREDGFVVKLNAAGAFLWSTCLGGAEDDGSWGIAVGSSGNVYVAGETCSSGQVNGGGDTSYDGYRVGYLAKLNAAGAQLWSTYLGGTETSSDGWAADVAINSSGDVYVAGMTNSSGWVSGGWDTSYNGGRYDGFLVKISHF